MIDNKLKDEVYRLWNEGYSSGWIAQKLLIDVGYINCLISRGRKRGVELRRTPPVKRTRQISL